MSSELLDVPIDQLDPTMLTTPVLLVVRMRAIDGRADEVQREVSGAFNRIRSGVPECSAIFGYREVTDDGVFLLYELWESLESLRQFLQRSDMVSYLERLDEMLEWRELSLWNEFGAPI